MPETNRVTREQALAFLEALTGTESFNDYGDPSGKWNSPAAMNHLAAALGYGNVISAQSAASRAMSERNVNMLDELCEYLDGVIFQLRKAGNIARPTEAFTWPADIPDDLAEAIESFKLSIKHQKFGGWREISQSDVVSTLRNLERIATQEGA